MAILFSAQRTYVANDGIYTPDLSNPRDYGTLCEIVAFIDGRWVEAYSGHDCFEEWRGDDVPTHYLPLPPAPKEDASHD